MNKANNDDNLRNVLEPLVAAHGMDAIVRVLCHLSRKEGHAAKFDREDHQEADSWYQVEASLLSLAGQIPGKKEMI